MTKLCIPSTLVFSFLCVLACGRADEQNMGGTEESVASVASEPATTLTNACADTPLPDSKATAYCKNLSDGSPYQVTLNPTVYVQDQATCEITAKDDGLRVGMLEMGFTPCDLSEASDASAD